MRLSAIAITALLAIGVHDSTAWQSAVLSIGFGHYLLSVWYARAKLAKVASPLEHGPSHGRGGGRWSRRFI